MRNRILTIGLVLSFMSAPTLAAHSHGDQGHGHSHGFGLNHNNPILRLFGMGLNLMGVASAAQAVYAGLSSLTSDHTEEEHEEEELNHEHHDHDHAHFASKFGKGFVVVWNAGELLLHAANSWSHGQAAVKQLTGATLGQHFSARRLALLSVFNALAVANHVAVIFMTNREGLTHAFSVANILDALHHGYDLMASATSLYRKSL